MDNHMNLASMAFATRQNYIRSVKILIEHYQKVPEQCSVDEIKKYLVYQKDVLNTASSTLNIRVASLKYYFRHIVKRLDLVVSIPNPRVPTFDTEIFTYQEMSILFDACKDMRQLLIIQLMYECGLRISEVVKLRVGDFDKKDFTISIRKSKGNVSRVVYYGHSLRDTLNKYALAIGLHGDYLISSYVDKQAGLSLSGIQHIVKEIIRRSKIKKKASSHTIRHNYAVHFLNNGGSLYSLQLLLGHKHLTTTLEYLKHANLPDSIRVSNLDILKKR